MVSLCVLITNVTKHVSVSLPGNSEGKREKKKILNRKQTKAAKESGKEAHFKH